ncbi:HIT domain-containing protein [Candidatus Pacearchaeota archaeon]|nr:HIT domain-containing protein [Candidatus Pacearchaeota archaeon]
MTLTKEQISALKKQLHEQIKRLPEDKRKEAEKQIDDLSDEAIEEMLEKQKDSQVNIFREIVSGKIPSKKIDENSEALAVLEIRPISKGHVIIIPKERLTNLDKIPENISILIDKVSKDLSTKLKAKEVKIIPEKKLGEVIINLIPIYDKELNLESERSNQLDSELNEIIEIINKEDEKIEIKKEEPKKEELKKFKRRIP